MTAQTRRGEKTSEEILAAARSHLAESGLEAFSLREVARRADLSPSALYNHFENRDALVNALAMECVQLLGAYFGASTVTGTAGERLRHLGEAYLRFAREEPVRYRLVFDVLESPLAEWDRYAQVAYPFTALVEAVTDGLQAGEFVDHAGIGASGIAYGLWSIVHGSVMLRAHHLAHVDDDLDGLALSAVDTFIAGLTPTATPVRPRSKGASR